MLGRLFKQQSTPTLNNQQLPNGGGHNLIHNNQPVLPHGINTNSYTSSANSSSNSSIHTPGGHSANAPSLIPNSYDDSYMREILYGVSEPLKPFPYNAKLFRIVVCQDGGSLRSKQILFDSSFGTSATEPLANKAPPISRRDSGNIKSMLTPQNQKVHHNINDLNDYMFGCGIPTNESQSSTKLHILNNPNGTTSSPPASSPASSSNTLVLISRLFSISDELPTTTNSSDWNPAATLPIKEASIPRKLHSRFSIGLVIPIENDQITDAILQNWNEISHFLIVLQKMITKKLVHILESTPNTSSTPLSSSTKEAPMSYSSSIWTCPFVSNKRIQFPSHILQSEIDLNNQVFKLIKLMNYNSNIPRLINLHQVMLKNPSNPIVYNWISEILNWSEFKDGNISFLASLFSIVLTMRHGLKRKPLDGVTESDKNNREISRIVIMTGNPMVAKKLIFIINGLIPNIEVNQLEEVSKKSAVEEEEINRVGCISPQSATPGAIVDKVIVDVDDTTDSGDETDQFSFDPPPRGIGAGEGRRGGPGSSFSLTSPKPIPIRQQSVNSGSVGSPDSIKGWEIPSSYSGSTLGKPRIETDTKVIPIVQQAPVHRNSLSKSQSMAYLSSSLNSSLSSSISNYSLTKLSGSFLEKWKNFGTSGGGNGSSFGNGSMNGSSYGNGNYGSGFGVTGNTSGGGFGSFNEPNINKRGSIASLRSPPSPALDSEEFFNTYGKITNPSISAHKNLSRTQSMFDINEGLTTSSPPSLNQPIIRTNTSILVKDNGTMSGGSSINRKGSNFNQELIKARCLSIMKSSPKYSRDRENEKTLTVDVNEDSDSLITRKGLLPNVAFSDEFRQEFLIQSCPINPKLESLVMNAMKNDLLFFQNNCQVEHVNSKTLFISLRAREIKLIEMNNGESKPQVGNDNENVNNNNNNNNKFNNYKTTIRKIFTPQKNCGNKERIASIEEKFRALNYAFGCTNGDRERDNERLSRIVVDLIQ